VEEGISTGLFLLWVEARLAAGAYSLTGVQRLYPFWKWTISHFKCVVYRLGTGVQALYPFSVSAVTHLVSGSYWLGTGVQAQ